MVYSTRTTCRLCNGSFKDIISLGDIYLSTFVDTNDNTVPKAPIDLVQCGFCGLVQLRHTVNPDIMYTEYWYQSGLNRSMIDALSHVVAEVQNRILLQPGDAVLDIGANDGTLLANYPDFVTKIACEPNDLIQIAMDNNRADIYINDFFTAKAIKATGYKPKVITAIAMFYDLEDPHTFVQDLADILADGGLLVIQMMDLMSMVKLNDFPNLCHEHIEYYSLKILYKLLNQHGLEIIDVQYNGVNGGSLRIYAKPIDKQAHAYIMDDAGDMFRAEIMPAIDAEDSFFLNIDLPTYFRDNIENIRTKIVGYINRCNKEGKNIAVLGASTKGNTILQYFGLNNTHITHAAEINPDKFGKQTIGSNIPIIPQEKSIALNPDYYLVLPWGFIDFFIKKFKDYLNAGGIFIVPLPTPRIITMQDGVVVEYNIP